MSGQDNRLMISPPEEHDDVTPSELLSENQDSCTPDDCDRSTAAVSDRKVSEEEDDGGGGGFRTPTDRRIPAATECPPPPQKPRPQPSSKLKRKASPPGDPQFEAEVESIFRQIPADGRKMKKARRDDKDPA